MKIETNNIEIKLINCNKFYQRLIGNMFTKNIKPLIFKNCNSIHTFFVKKEIDVFMFDKNKKLIKIYKNLKPWKIIFPKKNIFYVVELPTNTIKNNSKIKLI